MFHFDLQKALEAAAFLLKLHPKRRMSYLRLLKLLYIADREYLFEEGETITGDRAVAMKNGPVLSKVYDIIGGKSADSDTWRKYIQTDHYEVELRADPGSGELSRAIKDKLKQVTEKYQDMDDWTISDLTHEFEEWKRAFSPPALCAPISWEQVLELNNKGDMVERVQKDEEERALFDAVFGKG